jgi:hypothetical protein
MNDKDKTVASIEVIKASDAPGIPKKQSKVANELLNALGSLKKDEVLKLVPDPDKSIRGLKTSVGRITSNAGIKIQSWSDDEAVYIAKQS